MPKLPFDHSSGPHDARIALVGEAFGEQEDKIGRPFVGAAGQELTRLLTEAGLRRSDCFLTNAFALRPPGNKLEALCVPKAEVGKNYPLPPISNGKYVPWELLPEVERLGKELDQVRPNLVITLGAVASWAILASPKISQIRGTTAISSLVPGLKVLPTYHPAAVLRNWSLRPIVLTDLMKAKREATFPEIRRPERYVLINPTLSEIAQWATQTMATAQILSVDIETARSQITCIGFARSRSESMVIPFAGLEGNYWPTHEEEVHAWGFVRALLESPIPKLFQNGLYDLQYLAKMGFRPRNCIHDTMLLHHSLFPEMQKGLGFLGSIYTSESSWKLMRKHKPDTEKRDE